MAGVSIESQVERLQRALGTSTTAASYVVANYLPTITRPADGTFRKVVDLFRYGPKVQNTLRIWPFGNNDNNDVITVKVCGWGQLQHATQDRLVAQFVSTPLCTVTATLSSALLGIAGRPLAVADLLADTLSLTAGTAVLYQGTADVDPASFLLDVSGFELVTIDPALSTNADGANALFAFL